MTCPLCKGAAQRAFQKDGWWISDCTQCGHRFTEIEAAPEHAATIYDDSYFTEGGAGYQDYLAEADLLIAHGQRYGKLLKKHIPTGTVLDVGAAAGFILRGLVNEGWQGQGIEPNARMAQHAQEHQGVMVQAGTLEDLALDQQFDLITMVQVVAHFYDIRQAFEVAARSVKTGGHLLIETWNKDSWLAKMLDEGWHEYSPPSVVHFFSPDRLSQFVAEFGFKEVARGRPAKWLNGAHAKSLLQYKLGQGVLSKAVNIVPDKLPIPYPSFDLFWGLYGKA